MERSPAMAARDLDFALPGSVCWYEGGGTRILYHVGTDADSLRRHQNYFGGQGDVVIPVSFVYFRIFICCSS